MLNPVLDYTPWESCYTEHLHYSPLEPPPGTPGPSPVHPSAAQPKNTTCLHMVSKQNGAKTDEETKWPKKGRKTFIMRQIKMAVKLTDVYTKWGQKTMEYNKMECKQKKLTKIKTKQDGINQNYI